MKNIITLLIVTAGCIFLSLSCSKKSSNKQTCQIVTVTDQVGSATATTYNLTYDNSGRISTEQYGSTGSSTTRVFTYIGSTEEVTTTDGSSSTTDSIVLNSDGLMEADYFTGGGVQSVTIYTYNGTECIKAVTTPNGGTPSTTTLTWTNGDLTSLSDGSSTQTYSYNTKPTAQGDYFQILQLVNYGAVFIRNTHQIIAFQSGSTIEDFNYTSDNTGKITSLTGTGGSNVETISYQYTCN
jgi:hypothetical protein